MSRKPISEAVKVNVHGAYQLHGSNPGPVAFLWINGRIHNWYPCGTAHRRVKWLPRWFPFNTRYCYSLTSQAACVRMLKEIGSKLAAEIGGQP